MAEQYDVVVLGGGTGGYVAAIRAASYGLKTAIVEREKLGGTCLHKGCIPTKSMLKSAEMYQQAKKLADYGVLVQDVSFDYLKMLERKQNIVDTLHQGVKGLVKKGGVDVYYGTGTILGPSIFSPMPGTISVVNGDEEPAMLLPTNIIIATGSRPRALPFLPFNGTTVVSSDDMLQIEQLPTSICIIGGGVIGIEWATMLHDLGVVVTIVEGGPTILPTEDEAIQQEMHKQLKSRGIKIFTNVSVTEQSLTVDKNITLQHADETIIAEKLFVAIGREACTQGIGLENTDIEIESGFIKVNSHYQTKEAHMFAIGDCIGGLQLAHVASAEGLSAVEYIANKSNEPIQEHLVPKCIYSTPQIASVGLTEKQAKQQYENIIVKKIPFAAIGKAHSNGAPEGFMKAIVEAKYGEIIGIHCIGKDATELISEGTLAMTLNAVAEELTATVHAHPTLGEIYFELANAIQQKGIHF